MATLGSTVNIIRCDNCDATELNVVQMFGSRTQLFKEAGVILNPQNMIHDLQASLRTNEALQDVDRYAMQDLIDLAKQAKKYDWIFFPL